MAQELEIKTAASFEEAHNLLKDGNAINLIFDSYEDYSGFTAKQIKAVLSLGGIVQIGQRSKGRAKGWSRITLSEKYPEAVKMLKAGKSDAEVAESIGTSTKTVQRLKKELK